MNYSDPQTRSLLAAEYVIGTLQGPARKRFEALLVQDTALRTEVERWERELHQLLHRYSSPTAPDARVLSRVMHQLGLDGSSAPVAAPSAARQQRPAGGHRRRRRWSLAAAAMVLIALVVLLLPETLEQPEPPDIVAELEPVTTLSIEQEMAAWTVGKRDRLLIVSLPEGEQVALSEDADYELWWVGDSDPISLGLLPRRGAVALALADAIPAVEDGALAISLEARGGSVTGAPAEVIGVFPL